MENKSKGIKLPRFRSTNVSNSNDPDLSSAACEGGILSDLDRPSVVARRQSSASSSGSGSSTLPSISIPRRKHPDPEIEHLVCSSLNRLSNGNSRQLPSFSSLNELDKERLELPQLPSIEDEKENVPPFRDPKLAFPDGDLWGHFDGEENWSVDDDDDGDDDDGVGDDHADAREVVDWDIRDESDESDTRKNIGELDRSLRVRAMIPQENRVYDDDDDDYVYSSPNSDDDDLSNDRYSSGGTSTTETIDDSSNDGSQSLSPHIRPYQNNRRTNNANILIQSFPQLAIAPHPPPNNTTTTNIDGDDDSQTTQTVISAEILSSSSSHSPTVSAYSTDDDFIIETTHRPTTSATASTLTLSPLSSNNNNNQPSFPPTPIVKPNNWTLGERIGTGSFGVVHVGMNDLTGHLMAVKTLVIGGGDGETEGDAINATKLVKDMQREVDVMRMLDHPHIVRYYGAEVNVVGGCGRLHIFQEWVPGGSVDELLKRFGVFSTSVVRSYLRQILEGLAYLHGRNILHRDIKGGNVLVSHSGVVKLADFGASREFDRNFNGNDDDDDMKMSMTMKGTPYFMAPEVFDGKYNSKADIWSVGGVVLQMATGQPPWKQLGFTNPMTLFFYLKSNDEMPSIRFDKKKGDANNGSVDAQLESVIKSCFNRDPDRRPSAHELLKHDMYCSEGSFLDRLEDNCNDVAAEGNDDDDRTKMQTINCDVSSYAGLSDKTKQTTPHSSLLGSHKSNESNSGSYKSNNSSSTSRSKVHITPRIDIMTAHKQAMLQKQQQQRDNKSNPDNISFSNNKKSYKNTKKDKQHNHEKKPPRSSSTKSGSRHRAEILSLSSDDWHQTNDNPFAAKRPYITKNAKLERIHRDTNATTSSSSSSSTATQKTMISKKKHQSHHDKQQCYADDDDTNEASSVQTYIADEWPEWALKHATRDGVVTNDNMRIRTLKKKCDD